MLRDLLLFLPPLAASDWRVSLACDRLAYESAPRAVGSIPRTHTPLLSGNALSAQF